MTEEKKRKKLKSLIRFHNANKIDSYNYRGGKKGQKKNKEIKEKNHKESTEQVKP